MSRHLVALAIALVILYCQAAPVPPMAATIGTAENTTMHPGMSLTPSVRATVDAKLQDMIAELRQLMAAMKGINNAMYENLKRSIQNIS